MSKNSFCIFTHEEDHLEGLFGKICYHILQILPFLHERNLYPDWDIRTRLYGVGPSGVTIPGVLDLAYPRPEGPLRRVSALEIRRRHAREIGHDWVALNDIWSAYFRVPQHIEEQASALLPRGRILGVHYRGNDKLTSLEDSNPISHLNFLRLLREYLDENLPFDSIFAATDDFSFVHKLQAEVKVPVINLGKTGFHKVSTPAASLQEKTERAMLDCVLLSRCTALLETSSALPSFAKLLNPSLEAYRTAASKMFDHSPYFPVAYIPILPVKSVAARDILATTLKGDWTFDDKLARYREPFSYRTLRPIHNALFTAAERVGLGDRITVHR